MCPHIFFWEGEAPAGLTPLFSWIALELGAEPRTTQHPQQHHKSRARQGRLLCHMLYKVKHQWDYTHLCACCMRHCTSTLDKEQRRCKKYFPALSAFLKFQALEEFLKRKQIYTVLIQFGTQTGFSSHLHFLLSHIHFQTNNFNFLF